MQLAEVLKVNDVQLALGSSEQSSAIDEVLAQLNGDERVTDWEVLRNVVIGHEPAMIESGNCGICIAHGRTQALKSLVVAAGRSDKGLPNANGEAPIRLIFVAGIPATMNAQYLAVVGGIARVCNNKRLLDRLLSLKSPTEFVETLQNGCAALDC